MIDAGESTLKGKMQWRRLAGRCHGRARKHSWPTVAGALLVVSLFALMVSNGRAAPSPASAARSFDPTYGCTRCPFIPPDAPTNLTIGEVNATNLTLNWTDNPSAGPPISNDTVWQGPTCGDWNVSFNLTGSILGNFSVPDMAANTTYCFAVQSYNGVINSTGNLLGSSLSDSINITLPPGDPVFGPPYYSSFAAVFENSEAGVATNTINIAPYSNAHSGVEEFQGGSAAAGLGIATMQTREGLWGPYFSYSYSGVAVIIYEWHVVWAAEADTAICLYGGASSTAVLSLKANLLDRTDGLWTDESDLANIIYDKSSACDSNNMGAANGYYAVAVETTINAYNVYNLYSYMETYTTANAELLDFAGAAVNIGSEGCYAQLDYVNVQMILPTP
jgi:hypothetical protein